jgi:hypothetical protein
MVRGEVHTGIWWGNLREGDNLEDPGLDGRMDFQKVILGGMDWIDLTQDMDWRQVLLNVVMNLWIP